MPSTDESDESAEEVIAQHQRVVLKAGLIGGPRLMRDTSSALVGDSDDS